MGNPQKAEKSKGTQPKEEKAKGTQPKEEKAKGGTSSMLLTYFLDIVDIHIIQKMLPRNQPLVVRAAALQLLTPHRVSQQGQQITVAALYIWLVDMSHRQCCS